MADKYLVPCSCGKSVVVAVHQAGSTVVCECGSQVSVPPLRRLRELPRDTSEIVTEAHDWTPRQAVASAGAILAVALVLWGSWQWLKEPAVPKFDQIYEDKLNADADDMLTHATPLQFWHHHLFTSPIYSERGFEEISSPQQEGYIQHIEELRLRRQLTFAAAGLVAALSAVVWYFWPKPLP